jgi:hypothetical protein
MKLLIPIVFRRRLINSNGNCDMLLYLSDCSSHDTTYRKFLGLVVSM